MKILIAPNSFKECADSVEIASLFSENLNYVDKSIVPISDGGDGFLKVCQNRFKEKCLSYNIKSIYSKKLTKIPFLLTYDGKVFVESADIVGLKIIPPKYRNPLLLSSAPIGEFLLRLAEDVKKKKIKFNELIIGIGGTGVHDFGIGMLSKLGLILFDKNLKELKPIPLNFIDVKDISFNFPGFPFEIRTIIDVELPLTGKKGSVKMFAPQKGASKEDTNKIEDGINNIIKVLNLKYPDKKQKLTGAGGGLAAALNYFFDTKIKKAKDFILTDLGLKKEISEANYIITGEGKFDEQSLLNKGTGIIIKEVLRQNKKVFLCSGSIDEKVKKDIDENVIVIQIMDLFKTKEESIKNYKSGINKMCKIIAQSLR